MAYTFKKRSTKIYRKKSTPSKKTIVKKAFAKQRTNTIKRVVKRVLAKQEEVKCQVGNFSMLPESIQTGTATVANNYFVASPSSGAPIGYTLSRGTGNYQMIGNKVRTRSCVLKFSMSPQPYNALINDTVAPQMVRVYLFKSKDYPVNPLDTADLCGANAKLFENGSSYTGFQGYPFDMNLKIQRDSWTYLGSRTFKLASATPTGTTASTVAPQTANNDFKLFVNYNWNITKFLNKVYTLSDQNEIMQPWVFCLIQTINAAPGNTPFVAGQLPLSVTCQVQYRFTDV